MLLTTESRRIYALKKSMIFLATTVLFVETAGQSRVQGANHKQRRLCPTLSPPCPKTGSPFRRHCNFFFALRNETYGPTSKRAPPPSTRNTHLSPGPAWTGTTFAPWICLTLRLYFRNVAT